MTEGLQSLRKQLFLKVSAIDAFLAGHPVQKLVAPSTEWEDAAIRYDQEFVEWVLNPHVWLRRVPSPPPRQWPAWVVKRAEELYGSQFTCTADFEFIEKHGGPNGEHAWRVYCGDKGCVFQDEETARRRLEDE